MLRPVSRILLGVLLVSGATAASSLENARRAAAMLGAETWSRVIRVENAARRSVYPATFHALVFEFGGLLWFYTDVNGTQSFSLHTNSLAAEKADFAPLLREIDSGLTGYSAVASEPAPPVKRFFGSLPNGCFIESAAALRERVARGDLIARARLLSFYGVTSVGQIGHTVLAYETPGGAFALDLQASNSPRRIGRHLPEDPRLVAAAVRPELAVISARWVPTTMPRAASLLATMAGAATRGRPAEAERDVMQ